MLTQINFIHAISALNLKTFRHFFVAIIVFVMVFDMAVNAKYFDSVNSLQELYGIERDLVKVVHKYLEEQETEFETYQKFIETIKLEQSMAEIDLEDYLGNPINAFRLIKRLSSDWNQLHDFIRQSNARKIFREAFEKLNEDLKEFDENEFKGAVKGLARLQKLYNLSEQDLVEGDINGMSTNTKLSWSDCFEIAVRLFDQKELPFSLKWFEKSFEKLNATISDIKDATHRRYEIEILEYLAINHYELGNSETSLKYIDKILELEPNHNVQDLRIFVMNSDPNETTLRTTKEILNQNYTKLCQGIQSPQIGLHSRKCTLDARRHPFYILAPLKVEEVYKDPEIKIYHGLLTDKQIDDIVNEKKHKMIPDNHEVGTNESNIHVSQQTWRLNEILAIKSLWRLVELSTENILTNSDRTEVKNYGIGGHNEPHYDFEKISKDLKTSDFLSNILYLSNVEQGGFTVFPKLNIYIRPVKGSMVSWHNLHRSLNPDYRTLHAGCPVIIGSKTIANLWVRSDFLLRPCLLEDDSGKSQGDTM